MALGNGFSDVLAAARTGEPHALGLIYADLHPAVLTFMASRAPADADDLASDVFIAVAAGLSGFEGDERAFRGWVFTIAYRTLGHHWRRLGRRRTRPVSPEDLEAVIGAGAGDAETGALEAIGTARALAMMAGLPPDQAEVLILRVVGDLSAEEVGRVLGKKPGAVRALQYRALRRLRRQLSQFPDLNP